MADTEFALHAPYVPYLPASITQVPKPVIEYARYMVEAPLTALAPARADGVEQQPIELSKRHRTRLQVGQTNRWRLPQSLLSDLLGISQAQKSLRNHSFKPFNPSYVKVYTAEGRHSFLNDDINREYPSVEDSDELVRVQSGLPSVRTARVNSQNQISSRLEPRLIKSAPLTARIPRDNSSRLSRYVPERARPANCKDIFLYHSKQNREYQGAPDVILHCLEMDFELHSSVLQRAPVLAELFKEAVDDQPTDTVYYKNSANHTLDTLINSSGLYNNNNSETFQHATDRDARRDLNHPGHTSQAKHGNLVKISLDVPDGAGINQNGMAIALGNLYHSKSQVDDCDLPSVLLAADCLGFMDLVYSCIDKMRTLISYENISVYYMSSVKTCQTDLTDSCIRWLEVNLIPMMMTKIQLREVPYSLLEIVLKSSRLFTYEEYSLYLCLSLWLFLKINPQIQLLPSPTNVVTYFNSLPKHSSYLEREGQMYQPLFDSLRLHGITNTSQFENIRLMNILPADSMISLLSEHYSALQSGGDMALMRNFMKSAVRKGYVIEKELPYHSDILSLHGFHFELKTVKTSGTYTFFMQRLKPTDTLLSFRQCERQTFSMRPDRAVIYSITVQTYSKGVQHYHSSQVQTQRFSLNGKHIRSKVLSLHDVTPPLYVTFALLFPQS